MNTMNVPVRSPMQRSSAAAAVAVVDTSQSSSRTSKLLVMADTLKQFLHAGLKYVVVSPDTRKHMTTTFSQDVLKIALAPLNPAISGSTSRPCEVCDVIEIRMYDPVLHAPPEAFCGSSVCVASNTYAHFQGKELDPHAIHLVVRVDEQVWHVTCRNFNTPMMQMQTNNNVHPAAASAAAASAPTPVDVAKFQTPKLSCTFPDIAAQVRKLFHSPPRQQQQHQQQQQPPPSTAPSMPSATVTTTVSVTKSSSIPAPTTPLFSAVTSSTARSDPNHAGVSCSLLKTQVTKKPSLPNKSADVRDTRKRKCLERIQQMRQKLRKLEKDASSSASSSSSSSSSSDSESHDSSSSSEASESSDDSSSESQQDSDDESEVNEIVASSSSRQQQQKKQKLSHPQKPPSKVPTPSTSNASSSSIVVGVVSSKFRVRDEDRLDDVRAYGRALMRAHGLDVQGWSFGWDHAKRRACNLRGGHHKLLTFSYKWVRATSDDAVRNLIIQFVAGASVGSPHFTNRDEVWCRKVKAMGGITTEPTIEQFVKPPWLGVCTGGCTKVARFKRTALMCLKCGGTLHFARNIG